MLDQSEPTVVDVLRGVYRATPVRVRSVWTSWLLYGVAGRFMALDLAAPGLTNTQQLVN